jgi:nitrogen regulatory protein PII
MKMIVAIVQPQQLPSIKDSLHAAGLTHMTCTNVLGTVANEHEEYKYRGATQEITLFQKVRIEIAVKDQTLDKAIGAISEGAVESGGAGKIFVTEITDCVTPRTGARGESEL